MSHQCVCEQTWLQRMGHYATQEFGLQARALGITQEGCEMKKTTQLTLLSVLVAVIGIAGGMQQVRANTPSEVADAQSEGTIKVAAVTKDAIDQMVDDQRKLTKAQNQEARDSAAAAY
jgi:hypothetical protein